MRDMGMGIVNARISRSPNIHPDKLNIDVK